MQREALGELIELATCDVFSTMLGLDLTASPPTENLHPLRESEVTAMIGLAGDQQGFVSVQCTAVQAREFTARLLGMEPQEVTENDDVLDAMGEVVNMVAGNVKRAYSSQGTLEISLPTVVMTPKSEIRVKGASSVVMAFEGPAGPFEVEVMLAEPGV